METPRPHLRSERYRRAKMARPPSRRVQKELQKLSKNPIDGLTVADASDLGRWVVQIVGAAGTIYSGETYRLAIKFPPNYPIEAPEVTFLQPAPQHPHIYTNGHVCLSILYTEWSPALTVESVCLSILSMLSSCTKKELPEDNDSYVRRVKDRSPKLTMWAFHDDTV